MVTNGPGWAWCGDKIVPFSEARVPIEDRGLQFGESIYEIIAVVNGVPFHLDEHVARMEGAARELGLAAGVPPVARWAEIIADLHRREPHRTAILYAQITGGTAPRAHVPRDPATPFFFAYLRSFEFPGPAEISQGFSVHIVPETRWVRRDLKTTMLLPAVLAKRQALSRGSDEAIFVGQDGFVNEGASSAVFAVNGRTVTTLPDSPRLLPAVSSIVVRELCGLLGLPFQERPLTLSDLHGADELFLASTTTLLMPIVALDGRKVRGGSPGAVTMQLAYHFQRAFWAPLQG